MTRNSEETSFFKTDDIITEHLRFFTLFFSNSVYSPIVLHIKSPLLIVIVFFMGVMGNMKSGIILNHCEKGLNKLCLNAHFNFKVTI